MKFEPRRKERVIKDQKEIDALMERMSVGRLGMTTDEGPYVVPMNYLYADGYIYLHSALKGRKIDELRSNPRVCFLVDEPGPQVVWDQGCGISQIFESVICFGTAEIVEDHEEKQRILEQMVRKFVPPDHSFYSLRPLKAEGVKKTAVVKIKVEGMSCKANRLMPHHTILHNRFQTSGPGR